MESNRHSRAGEDPVSALITDNIDVWTSAIKKRNSQGRGSSKKIELTGIKKLRELILELAVRGKLVPQDPNDESASVLLEKIAEEKTQLIADKKIRKQSKSAIITDEEKPFETPYGWSVNRLIELSILENGDRSKNYPNKSLLVQEGIPFVNAGHLTNGMVDQKEMTFITQERFDLLSGGKFRSGDILYCLRGSLGKSALVENIATGAIASSLVIIRTYSGISHRYLMYYFDSPFAYYLIKKYDNGTAQPNLSATDLAKFIVPLPPLAEQHRIVAKVDELMALCDQLEQQTEQSLAAHQTLVTVLLATLTNCDIAEHFQTSWQRISDHFDVLFTTEASIEQLKQTILQLAVMGKLVPQNPKDEPASVLLEKIAAEKAQLIKDKKIKKQKPLPEITDEEKPVEMPSGWEYERIGTFGIVGTGSTPSRSNTDYWQPAEYNWVSSGETSEFFVNETKEKVSALAIKETNVSLYPAGTLIIAMYGQGKTRGQITELLSEAGTNQACAAIRLVNDSLHHRDYVKLYFRKAYAELRSHAAGGAQPNLNVGKISNTVLALPPLLEQHRIVAKVDELMVLCEQLKARLSDAQTTQLHLADTVVENALN